MTSTDDALRLFGTLEPAPMIVRGGADRLRDRNWGTASAQVVNLSVQQHAERFDARFVLHMRLDDCEFVASARIEGRQIEPLFNQTVERYSNVPGTIWRSKSTATIVS